MSTEQLFVYAEVTAENTVSIVGVPVESRFYEMFRTFEEQSSDYIDPTQISDYETAEHVMEVLVQFAVESGLMDDEDEEVPFIVESVIKIKDTDSLIITVMDTELLDEEEDENGENWETTH